MRCLQQDNPGVFWKVLKKLLPGRTMTATENPKPQYMSLTIPEKIKISNEEIHKEYAYLLELAVEIVSTNIRKLDELTDQIGYMYETTLVKYLKCIENSIEFSTEDQRFPLWLHLREQIVLLKPTNEMVIYNYLDQVKNLIRRLEPEDIRIRYKELYLGNRYLFNKGDYSSIWKMLESRKTIAIKEIFDKFGIKETEKFGYNVKKYSDVAYKLGCSLKSDDISLVIDSCFEKVISQEFAVNCIRAFVHVHGAKELLKTTLCSKEESFILDILSKIPFSLELQRVVKTLITNESKYWEEATIPYDCQEEEAKLLEIMVNKLVSCRRYVAAVNLVGNSEFESVLDGKDIYKLLELAGTEESIGDELIDDEAVRKIISWVQQQNCIGLVEQSNIDFIYLPLLDTYSTVHPHALNTRLSLEPEYFCNLLELFFKKRSEDSHEIELDKGINQRLRNIFFQFKITPGVEWNGEFDESKFKMWMCYVKKWSKENDRYEVAMHTVGSGLSYSRLDGEKLPPKAIMEELNENENKELRRGYYLGIINQRGMHFIDPEGKSELQLSNDYRNRADIVEAKGYGRYAATLRDIAKQYRKEATNISKTQCCGQAFL